VSRKASVRTNREAVGDLLVDELLEKPAPEVQMLPFEKFDIHVLHRRDLVKAPYYAKEIIESNRIRMGKSIQKLGVLRPIVWNSRTKHVIDGWQTIELHDEKIGHDDYRLRVCAVDLDAKQEREAHIALNNPDAQGQFSIGPLAALFKDKDIVLDIAATGFDIVQVYRSMGESPFAAEERKEDLNKLAENMRASRDAYDKIVKTSQARDDNGFYTVWLFENGAERDAFHEAFGLNDNQWQNGRTLAEKFKEFGEWLKARNGLGDNVTPK
jgi:ribosomal protein S16